LDDVDVVFFCAQECKRASKTNIMEEIERFIVSRGFCLIEFTHMWEMFVIGFIRRDLRTEVS